MSVDKTDTHPSAISADEKAEMDKLLAEEEAELGAAGADDDDAAGDIDTTTGDSPDGDAAGDDKAGGKKAAANDQPGDDANADAAAGAAAGQPAAKGTADPADGKADQPAGTVDVKQFNGVVGELRETRETVKTLREALTRPREPLPERNFDAEDKAIDEKLAALDARYDNEGMSDDEFRAAQREIEKERRVLDRERNKYELLQQLEEERVANELAAAKQAKDAAEKAWAEQVNSWEADLGDWLKNPVRRATVSQTMEMMNADPELSKLDNDSYLAKLEEFLADAFPNFPKAAPAADKAGDTTITTDPRRKLAAARAAEVTGAPPRIEGGVGNRGTRTEDIDVEHMPHAKHGKTGAPVSAFGQLPENKQNELLGIE